MKIVDELKALRERLEETIKGEEFTHENLAKYLALNAVSSAIHQLVEEMERAKDYLEDVAS